MDRPALVAMLVVVPLFALAGRAADAQTLGDLQPGRNFTSAANFGTTQAEKIAPGDVDNDGDLDAGVGNGSDFGAQPNRIFINLGGLQAGTPGTFLDETASRFAGFTADASRDFEFVDVDGDGDLDAGVANDGAFSVDGEPSRLYTNLGGLQGGTAGYFADDTNLRWGTLLSVPAGQQVFGGNQGPFREFSCDCDFGDLDDDGDCDLFLGSYGPFFQGTHESRVFLNDGAGIFDERYPWANASADIKTRTVDFDLVDLDGDFDLDVAMSNNLGELARTYMNNSVNGIGSTLFNDITQTAFIATGATVSGNSNYAVDTADVDGDGDFDLWMNSYSTGNQERLLRNDGFTPGVGYAFTKMNSWIKGDPGSDDESIVFTDYDADGDLDAFNANFSGTNYLFQSGRAQGLDPGTAGLYHRTGTTGGGSLSPDPELPATGNGGTSLDGNVADVDGDGDEDLLLGNSNGMLSYLFTNVLGVPDTHAPAFFAVTTQSDKPNGSGTVLHAQIRDNSDYALAPFYDAELLYSVNGGAVQSVAMTAQGSMQFRGVIPAQTDAVIRYHVECTDLAGNTGFGSEVCFQQGAPADPWSDLGFGLAGASGIPSLTATGSLVGLCPLSIDLTGARPGSTAGLFVSIVSAPVPFKGGTLAAFPFLPGFPLLLPTGAGSIALPATLPAGANGLGLQLFLQYAIADATAVQGVALSNALRGDVP